MRDGDPRLMIGRSAAVAVALAASVLAGCTRAQWRHAFDPAPAPATSARVNGPSPLDCLPLLTRANEIMAVPGDSLIGAAAVRTNIAYTLALSDYSTCMARSAMP